MNLMNFPYSSRSWPIPHARSSATSLIIPAPSPARSAWRGPAAASRGRSTRPLGGDEDALRAFAAVNRLDLLKSVLGGRGRWTEAVACEASRSAAKLPPLLTLPSEEWLDEPIEIT